MIIAPKDIVSPPEITRVLHIGDATARAKVMELVVGDNYAHRLVQRLDALEFDWTPDAERTDPQMPKFSKRLWKALTSKEYTYDVRNYPTKYNTDNETMAKCAEIINAPRTGGRLLVSSERVPEPPHQFWELGDWSCFYGGGTFQLIAALGFHYVRVAEPVDFVPPKDDGKIRIVEGGSAVGKVAYGGEYWRPFGRFLYAMFPDENGVLYPVIMNAYKGCTIETSEEIVGELLGETKAWKSVSFETRMKGNTKFYANNSRCYTHKDAPIDSWMLECDGSAVTCAASGKKGYAFQMKSVLGKWYLPEHAPETEECPTCGREVVKGGKCSWCNIMEHPGYKGMVEALELVEALFDERGL